MSSPSNEIFWLEKPYVLITNLCRFNPLSNGTFSYNMNSYTRLIIIIMIILFAVTKEIRYIYVGIFLILVIIIMYYSLKNDKFTNTNISSNNLKRGKQEQTEKGKNAQEQTAVNLLKETSLPRRTSDYFNTQVPVNNPVKNIQLTEYGNKPKYSESTSSDSDMSKFVNGKIFQTPAQWIFDNSTIQFNTNAVTSIPNDQGTFANWLYGTENNCKSGSIYMHRTGTPDESQSCNGFNVSTPTNYGNLNDYVAPSN